jgi:hypothetical protein
MLKNLANVVAAVAQLVNGRSMMQLTDYYSINDLKENVSMKVIRKIYRNIFAQSTSIDLAKIELERSRKAFLEAKTHTEYYTAQVEFEITRIKRLEEYVNVIVEAGGVAPTVVVPVKKVALTKPAIKKTVMYPHVARRGVRHAITEKGNYKNANKS